MLYTFLGGIAAFQGRYAEAETLFSQAIRTAEQYGPREFSLYIVALRGAIRADYRTDPEIMVDLYKALTLAKKTAEKGYAFFIFHAMALFELACDDLDNAEVLAEKAVYYAKRFLGKNKIAEALTTLARITLRKGNDAQAVAYLTQALPLARDYCPAEDLATTLLVIADVAMRSGEIERAAEIYEEVQLVAPPKHHVIAAWIQYGLARLSAVRGNKKAARQYGKAALRILGRIKHVQTDEVQSWLDTLSPRWTRVLHRSKPKPLPQRREVQGILEEWKEGEASD